LSRFAILFNTENLALWTRIFTVKDPALCRGVMDYIICNRKRSKPKVSRTICQKCRKVGKCPDYMGYIQFSLFPDFMGTVITKEIFRRPVKPEKLKTKKNGIRNETRQLSFF